MSHGYLFADHFAFECVAEQQQKFTQKFLSARSEDHRPIIASRLFDSARADSPPSSCSSFICKASDYDPLLITTRRSEAKESSVDYFKGLQAKKHLYRDEFQFLEHIFQ